MTQPNQELDTFLDNFVKVSQAYRDAVRTTDWAVSRHKDNVKDHAIKEKAVAEQFRELLEQASAKFDKLEAVRNDTLPC